VGLLEDLGRGSRPRSSVRWVRVRSRARGFTPHAVSQSLDE
jgi:hypothetical protein